MKPILITLAAAAALAAPGLAAASPAVGKAYDARTTPHMFVIDRAGTLVYMGGIDDRATPWMGDARAAEAEVKSAKPYVKLALADIAAGRAVAEPVTRPYGCSVKYKDEAF